MYEFEETINGNRVLQRHRDLLKALADDNVMCVGYESDGNFYIQECCDEWYFHDLTEKECIELSALFSEIAETLRNKRAIADKANGIVPLKYGYCPICDIETLFITEDAMKSCEYCGHHLNLHELEEDCE